MLQGNCIMTLILLKALKINWDWVQYEIKLFEIPTFFDILDTIIGLFSPRDLTVLYDSKISKTDNQVLLL